MLTLGLGGAGLRGAHGGGLLSGGHLSGLLSSGLGGRGGLLSRGLLGRGGLGNSGGLNGGGWCLSTVEVELLAVVLRTIRIDDPKGVGVLVELVAEGDGLLVSLYVAYTEKSLAMVARELRA